MVLHKAPANQMGSSVNAPSPMCFGPVQIMHRSVRGTGYSLVRRSALDFGGVLINAIKSFLPMTQRPKVSPRDEIYNQDPAESAARGTADATVTASGR